MLSTMRTTIARVAAGAAVAAAATVLAATAPASAATSPAINSCDLSQTVAELNRYGDTKPQNVMVWAESADAYHHFNGVIKSGQKLANGCDVVIGPKKTYHWAVFTGSGEFVRKGDGGYRNWAFSGSWDRTADVHVVFHAVR